MRTHSIFVAMAVLAPLLDYASYGAPGDLDPSFTGGVTNYPTVASIAVQPDGKILAGGNFTLADNWSIYSVARFNPGGSLDMSFNAGDIDGEVSCVLLETNGDILIGGGFEHVGGSTRYSVARLGPSGTLDTSFNPGTILNGAILSMALQTDGKILIGGAFSTGTSQGIARLNGDGSMDTSFNVGFGTVGQVNSVVLQPDGKVLIGGDFRSISGVEQNYIARLGTNGTLDVSFNPEIPQGGSENRVTSMLLEADGQAIVAGQFTVTNSGTILNSIIRLNIDGSVDPSFNPAPGADTTIYAITSEADGHLVISGYFAMIGNAIQPYIARLNADGSLDQSFKSMTALWGSIYEYPTVLASQADNKVLIGGVFGVVDGESHPGIARLFGDYPPRFTSVTPSADGSVTVTGLAATNAHVEIDSTTNFLDWAPMAVFTNAEGTFNIEDPQLNRSYKQQFYRAVWLP